MGWRCPESPPRSWAGRLGGPGSCTALHHGHSGATRAGSDRAGAPSGAAGNAAAERGGGVCGPTSPVVRVARAGGIQCVRRPEIRLRMVDVRALRTPPTGPVFMRRPWLLPVVWRPPHGEPGRSLGGPGSARSGSSSMGGHRSLAAPLAAGAQAGPGPWGACRSPSEPSPAS